MFANLNKKKTTSKYLLMRKAEHLPCCDLIRKLFSTSPLSCLWMTQLTCTVHRVATSTMLSKRSFWFRAFLTSHGKRINYWRLNYTPICLHIKMLKRQLFKRINGKLIYRTRKNAKRIYGNRKKGFKRCIWFNLRP